MHRYWFVGLLAMGVSACGGSGGTPAGSGDASSGAAGAGGAGPASRFLQISAGRYHTCALLRDGSIHCWGQGAYRQLGGDYGFQGTARRVETIADARAIKTSGASPKIRRARAVLRRAVELGINFIDTAWYYGPLVANQLIAEVLHPYPRDLVIATKLGGKRLPDKGWAPALRPEELRKGAEEDLRTLRLERLDVVHLRNMPAAGVPLMESLDALLAMQAEGKIRHLALSNVNASEIEQALARGGSGRQAEIAARVPCARRWGSRTMGGHAPPKPRIPLDPRPCRFALRDEGGPVARRDRHGHCRGEPRGRRREAERDVVRPRQPHRTEQGLDQDRRRPGQVRDLHRSRSNGKCERQPVGLPRQRHGRGDLVRGEHREEWPSVGGPRAENGVEGPHQGPGRRLGDTEGKSTCEGDLKGTLAAGGKWKAKCKSDGKEWETSFDWELDAD
jgi:hypothetical protein